MSDGTRTLANRYVLERAIGRGGMGVVHRAHDRQLDRAVAVKLVSEVAEPTAKERFVAEARRTANLRHPSIVEVFDVGEDEGDAFLVMELLEGETLAERVDREPRIDVRDVISIADEICDALAVAHDAGLVHRDLKPANVFLVRRPLASRQVKLLDFGIAKRIDGATARTDPNMLVGSLAYISPEQIRGGPIDGRADLYALGMTMYRMLAGAPALDSDNAAALIHQHLSVRPTSLRSRAAGVDIPAWLDALVMRLVEKEPAARPASAHDVKRALANAGAAVEAGQSTVKGARGPGTAESPREGMRMLDLSADAEPGDGLELELDLDRSAAPPARSNAPSPPELAQVSPGLPAPVPPHGPPSHLGAPLPAWLEPLATVPIAVSKRVTGYSLFALALYLVFFKAALLPSLFLVILAGVGAVAMWAAARTGR